MCTPAGPNVPGPAGVLVVTVFEGVAMTAVRPLFCLAVLVGGLAACGEESQPNVPVWEEPASYTYTLTSSEGERALIGTFRVTVRDGKVAEAVGLDDSARRVVRQLPDQVPTLGELLDEAAQARQEGADTVEVEYAQDGQPTRILLDREENAIDDEARYDISAFEPGG